MSDFFPNSPPNQKLSPEEKRQIARRFHRKANLTDLCLLLSFALCLFGALLRDISLANALSVLGLLSFIPFVIGYSTTFYRCPVCGNRIIFGEYGRNLMPFAWRSYECPVCFFSPDWSK